MSRIENVKGNGFDKHPENINKKGRPKGKSITTLLKEKLDCEEDIILKDCQVVKNGKPTDEKVDVIVQIPTKEQIVNAALNRALKDQKTLEYIVDRLEGKPSQVIPFGSDELIEITYEDFNGNS